MSIRHTIHISVLDRVKINSKPHFAVSESTHYENMPIKLRIKDEFSHE